MRDKLTRMKSFGLALLMALASAPFQPVTMAYAAEARPQISFDTSGYVYVITGKTIYINEVLPRGYHIAEGGLAFTTDQGLIIDKNTKNSGLTINNPSTDDTRPNGDTYGQYSITFDRTFNPTGPTNDKEGNNTMLGQDPEEANKKTFTLYGRYYADKATGDVYERRDDPTSTEENPPKEEKYSNVSIYSEDESDSRTVMQDSTITIKVIKPETAVEEPILQIDAEKKGIGVFENLTQLSIMRLTGKTDDVKTDGNERDLILHLYRDGYADSINLLLHPKFTNDYETTDPDDPTKTITKTNNYIQEDTTFEIVFTLPRSNTLTLDVLTPQQAIQDVETIIKDDTGSSKSEIDFVSYAPNESFVQIEEPFAVKNVYKNYHGGNYQIEWEFIPTDVYSSEEGKYIAIKQDPNDSVYKENKDAIVPNNDVLKNREDGSDWIFVDLNRKEENVKGILRAIVYLDNTSGQKTTTPEATRPSFNVTVRGTGTPASVVEKNRIYGYHTGHAGVWTDNSIDGKELDTVEITSTTQNVSGTENKKEMNAYDGKVTGWTVDSEYQAPYEYNLDLNLGKKNGAIKEVRVELSPELADAVTLQYQLPSDIERVYIPGTSTIEDSKYGLNNNINEKTVHFKITANKIPFTDNPHDHPGTIKGDLTLSFWQPDPRGQLREESRCVIPLTINDSSPCQDANLERLVINCYKGDKVIKTITLGDPANHTPVEERYSASKRIQIPYAADAITFTPYLECKDAANYGIEIAVTNPDQEPVQVGTVNSNHYYMVNQNASGKISLIDASDKDKYLGRIYKAIITSPSQDPNTKKKHTIDFYRDYPSTDDALSSLGVYYTKDDRDKDQNNLITDFVPDGNKEHAEGMEDTYNVTIPYSTPRLIFSSPEPRDKDNAEGPEVKPDLEGENAFNTLLGIDKWWLNDLRSKFKAPNGPNGSLQVTFTVKSEALVANRKDAPAARTYTVNIYRQPPNTDATLKTLEVGDGDDISEDSKLTFTPTFKPDGDAYGDTYNLEIPYSIERLKLKVDPTDPNVCNIRVFAGTDDAKNLKYTLFEPDEPSTGSVFGLKSGNLVLNKFNTPPIDIPAMNDGTVRKMGYYPIIIKVYAEDESIMRTYEIRVQRAEPNDDATLKDLEIKDQLNVPVDTFEFQQYLDPQEYRFTVPYETTDVNFLPTMNYENISSKKQPIAINDHSALIPAFQEIVRIANKANSRNFKLEEPGKEKHFTLTVTAEDGKEENKKNYEFYITRELPSDDARLKGLVASDTSDFSPLFISSKTEYTATLNTGALGTLITATANHHGATIKIDGKVVKSGEPSELIELIEIKQTVKIEVTAQDGVTKMVYNIEFTNDNLIEKTNNADLKRLTVNYGQMTPNFKAAVTEYEVTVKEDTWSVDLIPRVSDPLATMRVLNGTRELGDYRGNYALALADGENQITVEVTSPDKTVVKNYDLTIYRNEEEKLKNLTPLEAEEVDYELSGNPIIIKVEEYPRIGASVFNTLREDYPEKSIIIQGNDYSIRFDGKNLTRVIPQREIFDFRMSFDSPDQEQIYDLIGDYAANDDIIDDAVLCYFDYHGSLPGPATLQLSLGRRYSNETLYWHYYNQERDRIDYYGSLRSNNKGTVAVSIDHFSTYIVTPVHRIAGSEDKDGVIDALGMISNGKDLLATGGKLNPDTGVSEDRP